MKTVKHIITHDNCADGIASAVILKLAWPEAEVTHAQYGGVLPEPADGMVFVDFSPPPTEAEKYVKAVAWCLDHHEGAKDVVALFGERGVYADKPGVSGASLALSFALNFVCGSRAVGTPAFCDFAMLVGIRDTWQKANYHFPRASHVSGALHFLGFEESLSIVSSPHFLSRLEELGRHVEADRKRHVDRAVSHASRFKTDAGTRVAIFDGYSLSSDAAEHPALAEVDMVVGSVSDGDDKGGTIFRYSCRSRLGYDVMSLAKRYGGGGHKHAAGFSIVPAEWVGLRHPWDEFSFAIERHEEKLGRGE